MENERAKELAADIISLGRDFMAMRKGPGGVSPREQKLYRDRVNEAIRSADMETFHEAMRMAMEEDV